MIRGYGNAPALGGEFAYLRTRRIPPGLLLEIDHSEVWTALQLISFDSVLPFGNDSFLWACDEDSAICYVPRFRREFVPLLRDKLKESTSVVVYSWQPETLAQYIRGDHVIHQHVSETLMRRFGLTLSLSPV